MLPILISVSLAPVSYLFWASAPVAVAASSAKAAGIAARRRCMLGISDLPDLVVMCRVFFGLELCGSCLHSIPVPRRQQEKAPGDEVAGGGIQVNANVVIYI